MLLFRISPLPKLSIATHLQLLWAGSVSGIGGSGNNDGRLCFVRTMAQKSKKGDPGDIRVRLIRYTLEHPRTPRTLRFGTMRMLRHWTIHRAWRLYQRAQWKTRELELERQYYKMRDACEELRKTSPGLYLRAIAKSTFRYPTVEMRIPTDTPPKGGWNHEWKRA